MVAFIQNCVDALSLGSLYALAALGIGLLFGMLRSLILPMATSSPSVPSASSYRHGMIWRLWL